MDNLFPLLSNYVTIFTRKTQIFIIPPTMSDRVGDDGVGVFGPGGRGDHGSSTSAS